MSKNDNEKIIPNINLPDKILPNSQNMKNDIMQFKDEILREIKLLKKSVSEKYEFIEILTKEKFSKYDTKLLSYSERINELKSNTLNTDDLIKEIDAFKEFKNKFRDTMLTLNIKINNMDKETKNDIYRIDGILSDSVIYTGIIGRTSKFKTFHQMVDYLLSQTSQNLTYREKNNLDLNQLKKKINSMEQEMQSLGVNMSKQISILFGQKGEEFNSKLKDLLAEYDQKIRNAKEQGDLYIQEIKTTVEKFREQLDEFINIKNTISNEIKNEVDKLVKENEKTNNMFRSNKKEFNLMKDRFTQLSEFIKDVRFRNNLGQEIKRREFNQISAKVDFSKKQKILSDKNIALYDTKYQNDNDLPDFLKSRVNSDESKKILKNKIKGRNNDNISKDNKTSEEYYLEENTTEKNNNNKFSFEKNFSESNIKKGIRRSNTAKFEFYNFGKFESKDNMDSKLNKNRASFKQSDSSSKINTNKNIYNKNLESKLFNRRNMMNEEMKNDSKRYLKFQYNKTPQSKILSGLNNKDNINYKNLSSIQVNTNSILSKLNFDENKKFPTPKSQFAMAEMKKIEPKKSSTSSIFFPKKTTVKNLVRIQSSLTPKYPEIINPIKKSNSIIISSQNNNKTTLEEDKNNTNKKNKLIKKEPIYVYFSYNKNKRNNNLRSHLSPNVKILQHSVENFYENNSETKNLADMVDNLQKYISGYDNYYASKNEIRKEKDNRKKNSEYFKYKDFFSEKNSYTNINNMNKKNKKEKTNVINIGFKEKNS